jgi:hypothetical protein
MGRVVIFFRSGIWLRSPKELALLNTQDARSDVLAQVSRAVRSGWPKSWPWTVAILLPLLGVLTAYSLWTREPDWWLLAAVILGGLCSTRGCTVTERRRNFVKFCDHMASSSVSAAATTYADRPASPCAPSVHGRLTNGCSAPMWGVREKLSPVAATVNKGYPAKACPRDCCER